MRRRKFIALLGSSAVVWPFVAKAQQPERMRRIGLLMNRAADNPEGQDRIAAFHQGLQVHHRTGYMLRASRESFSLRVSRY
jgi:putative tryptophan/tyrosine transport system substrate-binding protein